MDFLRSQLMEKIRRTAMTNLFGLMKMPLLAFLTPIIETYTEERVVVKIRLDYRSRNHLRSMYFGALVIGAELSIAALAATKINEQKLRVDFIFKDFQAEFLRRADNDVLFVFDDAARAHALIDRAATTTERLEETFSGYACLVSSVDPIMRYRLTLSVKSRARRAT